MTKFEQKKLAGICTNHGCFALGKHSQTDVDEPHGEKLLLCDQHNKAYLEELKAEEERYNCEGWN